MGSTSLSYYLFFVHINTVEKDKKKAEKDKEKDDEDEKHGGLDIGSLVHRAEKKVLMSFVGRKSLRPFLDDRSYSLIDALYRMRREYVALERLRSECGFDADQIANQLAAVGGSSSASKQARHVVHEARKDADKFVHNFIKVRCAVQCCAVLSGGSLSFTYCPLMNDDCFHSTQLITKQRAFVSCRMDSSELK